MANTDLMKEVVHIIRHIKYHKNVIFPLNIALKHLLHIFFVCDKNFKLIKLLLINNHCHAKKLY